MERVETGRTAKKPRSEDAVAHTSLTTVSDLNEVCLQHIFSLVGPGLYIFLSCCKRWQHAYWLYGELYMMTAPEHVVDNFSLFQWAVDAGGGGCPKSADLCVSAARSGQLPLQWLRDGGCDWDNRVCTEAARRGDIAMLRWAHQNLCPWSSDAAVEAARRGDLAMLQWAAGAGLELDSSACAVAAEGGHLETVQWLHAQSPNLWETLQAAAWSGQLQILQWLDTVVAGYLVRMSSITDTAASGGHLEVLQWLRSVGCNWDTWTCAAAAEGGHLRVLQYVHDNGCPWDAQTCSAAARGGHLDVLRYARQQGCPWEAEEISELAAKGGHLAVLRWAIDSGCAWQQKVCEIAARRGDVDMLNWAVANGAPADYARISLAARESAQAATARWLHSRQGDVLPLLVYASAAGRVGPIKWAHTSGVLGRRAGLIAQMAAENDRLEVLAYMLAAGILEDPAESQAPMLCAQGFAASFLTGPACAAAAHGRVQTLRWLQAHGAFRGSGVCAAAARDGHIHVLEWALANGCEWEERICHIAAEARNMALLAWAEARGCACRAHRKARYP
eukprot:TRINITY_DN2129_c0_g2_i1.p1 TRINITY_DN2129_c0_g2~~TRINITY_DN2129_c0_g2_i1.p1  ORF type:complete len:572 (-),score=80.44 TRINITY_DN2129_c0_g2_i1:74-1753(-)